MSRKLFASFFVAALSVLILAACQPVTEPTPTPASAEPAAVADTAGQELALVDTAWSMVSYGVDEEIPVVPDSFPSLNFLVSRYTGYTGCNFLLGSYLVDGNQVGMRWPSFTQGACENEALLQQQESFMSIISAVEQYEIDGDTMTFFVAGQPVMTLEPLEPAPFEGTTWNYKFTQIDPVEWLPVIPGTTVTAVFEGNTISGSAGCNDYTGAVTRDGNQMTISDIVTTRKMCTEPERIMDQEQFFLEKLQTTGSIQESARAFELRDTEKLPLMLFSAD